MNYLKSSLATPLPFISCGHFTSNESWQHTTRTIDSFEIIVGINKVLYMQQGDIQYEVGPGDVLLLLPNVTHQGYAKCEEDISFYWLHFDCPNGYTICDESRAQEQLDNLHAQRDRDRNNSDIVIPIYSQPPMIERINILFQQILHVNKSNYYTDLALHSLLNSLLIEITEQTVQQALTSHAGRHADKNLERILEWIRIHALSSDLSVTTIAEHFNYNKDYLSRYFKRNMNINLTTYIHQAKLSKAKDLLSRTSKSIKEIAYAVGIHDEKYFMRLFRKYEQITPSEYRHAYFRTHLNKE